MIETWRRQTANEFTEIVKNAVASEGHGKNGRAVVEMAGVAVRYSMYNQSNSHDVIDDIDGLGFSPQYAVKVATNHDNDYMFGRRKRPTAFKVEESATFGLQRRNRLVRTISVPSPALGMSFPLPSLILDRRKSEALIDFIRTPHLSHDAFRIIMEHTPEEDEEIARQMARGGAAKDSFATQRAFRSPTSRLRPMGRRQILDQFDGRGL